MSQLKVIEDEMANDDGKTPTGNWRNSLKKRLSSVMISPTKTGNKALD